MNPPALVCDIGGTKARFALARGAGYEANFSIEDATAAVGDLIGAALHRYAETRPRHCVLAVAGPVDGDHVDLTNRPSSFSQRALKTKFEFEALTVINDFAAQAHALPLLKAVDLVPVGGGRIFAGAPMLVCGPGTGFGCAVLLPGDDRAVALASEAGHMRLAAATADEARVLAHFVRDHGVVSVEHALSGAGLTRLHRIFSGETRTSVEVVRAAQDGDDAARATVHIFCKLFGRIAGDLALSFDARGGVFISGSLGRALASLLPATQFRAAFEEHPPYGTRLAAMPVKVVTHPEPGLLGAAVLAQSLWGR